MLFLFMLFVPGSPWNIRGDPGRTPPPPSRVQRAGGAPDLCAERGIRRIGGQPGANARPPFPVEADFAPLCAVPLNICQKNTFMSYFHINSRIWLRVFTHASIKPKAPTKSFHNARPAQRPARRPKTWQKPGFSGILQETLFPQSYSSPFPVYSSICEPESRPDPNE